MYNVALKRITGDKHSNLLTTVTKIRYHVWKNYVGCNKLSHKKGQTNTLRPMQHQSCERRKIVLSTHRFPDALDRSNSTKLRWTVEVLARHCVRVIHHRVLKLSRCLIEKNETLSQSVLALKTVTIGTLRRKSKINEIPKPPMWTLFAEFSILYT